MILNNKTPPHIVTLALIAAIAPLSMNVYLPSLPTIADYFNTDAPTAQLSVSLFLAGTAVLQLISGPLSDRYGRRPVLLGLLLAMLGATLVCIYAPTIEIFLFGRVLQATAAVGMATSRAVVRDMVEGTKAASMIAYVTMGMSLAPMIGPSIGGFLDSYYGWEASFWLIFGFTATVIVIVWLDLGETNLTPSDGFRDMMSAWPELLTSRRYWGYATSCAFSSAVFFAYLGGSPLIAIQYYGTSRVYFGILFLFVTSGYMVGNFLAGRYSKRIGLNNMVIYGNVVLLFGLFIALVTTSLFPSSPLAFFMPVFLLGLGNGIALPNANAGIVNVRPKLAGAASGLGGFMQIGGGALISTISGYTLRPESGPTSLIFLMIVSALLAIACGYYVMAIESRLKQT